MLQGSSCSRIGSIESPLIPQVVLSFGGHAIVVRYRIGAERLWSRSCSASNSISFVSQTIIHRIEHILPCHIIDSAGNLYRS